MTLHVTINLEQHHAAPRAVQRLDLPGRRDHGIRWGTASLGPKKAQLALASSGSFDPAVAPAGARLLPFGELEDGQCQWGFAHGDDTIFCGLPVDPKAKGTRLFKRYCQHHVKKATGRTVVR